MKRLKSVDELKEHFPGRTSVAMSSETRFAAQALMLIAEKLERIEMKLAKGTGSKRPASEWQKFFAEGMKAGRTPSQISIDWRARKQARRAA